MERIDKIISNNTNLSRNDVKKYIKNKLIIVNNKIIDSPKIKIDPNVDKIFINGEILKYQKYVYLVLNKPKGYVSATIDNLSKTVIDLCPDKFKNRNLFPAGRLDKDTTGLMIITDDGEFAHNILSPKKHIKKQYYVVLSGNLDNIMIDKFYSGLVVGNEKFKSAKLEILSNNTCYVTLTEGKYHEIKRMFKKYNLDVIELKRIMMGNLFLPDDLDEGECRELTSEELKKITS